MPEPTPPFPPLLPPEPEGKRGLLASWVLIAAVFCSRASWVLLAAVPHSRLAGWLALVVVVAAADASGGAFGRAGLPTSPQRPPSFPAAAATPALDSACTAEPATPQGSANWRRGWQAGSSSSEKVAHAGGVEDSSKVVPLLGGGSGRLAPGLRRRQGSGK
jgi:hypothetical protein